MEPENETATSVLAKKVGDIEKVSNKLTPAQVTIVGIVEKTKKSNGDDLKIPMIQFLCKHPDKPDEPISISKVKLIVDEKVITKTTWEVLDEEENIQMGSALDDVLKFLKCDCLADTEGKQLHTVVESKDSSFLCLKLFN